MSLFINNEFYNIKKLISSKNIQEEINHLETKYSDQNIDKNKLVRIKLLKAYLCLLNYSPTSALEFVKDSLSLAYKLNEPEYIFDSLILKAETMRYFGKFIGSEALRHPTIFTEIPIAFLPEFNKLIGLCDQLLEKITDKSSNEFISRTGLLLRCKGIILLTNKKFDLAEQNFLQSKYFLEKISDYVGIAGALQSIGLIYGIKGDIKKEVEFLEESLDYSTRFNLQKDIASILLRIGVLKYHYLDDPTNGLKLINKSKIISESLKDDYGIAASLNFIGNLYSWQGELDRGLSFLQRSLLISEKLEHSENLALTLNNIGWNHLIKGELNNSLESLNRSFTICKEKNYPWIITWTLSNLGYANQTQGDFDAACGYYMQSVMISKDINEYLATTWALYQLVKLNMDTNKLESGKKHIDHLEQLSNQYRMGIMSQMYRVSRGLLLKQNSRLRNKIKAQEYFEEVSNEKVYSLEVTVDALINQCQLLLFEYKISADFAVLRELESLSNRLLDIAEEQNSYSLLSEAYLLKSELSLLQEDYFLARKLINKAQRIAEEKKLNRLALAISREYDSLLDQIARLSVFNQYNQETRSGFNIEMVEDLLGKITNRNVIAVTEATPEESEMLLIIAEGGMTLFNYFFNPKDSIKSHLIGSFLSAIESFGKEIFSSPLERINLGEYRLVLQRRNFISIAYVYKGESYSAIKKLNKFISLLESQQYLLDSMKVSLDTGKLISSELRKEIINIINKIFLNVSNDQ